MNLCAMGSSSSGPFLSGVLAGAQVLSSLPERCCTLFFCCAMATLRGHGAHSVDVYCIILLVDLHMHSPLPQSPTLCFLKSPTDTQWAPLSYILYYHFGKLLEDCCLD